jgi:hypothetical protein
MPRSRLASLAVLVGLAAAAACESGTGSGDLSFLLAPDTAFVRLNETGQLAVVPRGGGAQLPAAEFTWTSSDPAIVAVSGGVVTALGYGDATVTARRGSSSASATVRVTGEPGLRVLSGDGVVDTIQAFLVLEAEVRDGRGVPLAGERVVLRGRNAEIEHATGFTSQSRDMVTNAAGRVRVRSRLGTNAGEASVELSSAARGLADTARFTVLHGAPVRVRIAPGDTAVVLGGTLQLASRASDRTGNAWAVDALYGVLRGTVAVNGAGVLTTTGYGPTLVGAAYQGLEDSVRIAVVPDGAFVAATMWGMIAMNFDGTGRRNLGGGRYPTWSPDGETVLYVEGDTLRSRSLVSGGGTPFVRETNPGLHHWPIYSPDGRYVYFFTSADGYPQTIWRVGPDGWGLERISSGSSPQEGRPAPAGVRLAYFSGGGSESFIQVRDMATGAETGRLTRGHSPAWSPVEDLIAFTEIREGDWRPYGVMVMRPDGTQLRRVSPQGTMQQFGVVWSPDGRWLLTTNGNVVRLLEVETGLLIDLPFLETVWSASWRPVGRFP